MKKIGGWCWVGIIASILISLLAVFSIDYAREQKVKHYAAGKLTKCYVKHTLVQLEQIKKGVKPAPVQETKEACRVVYDAAKAEYEHKTSLMTASIFGVLILLTAFWIPVFIILFVLSRIRKFLKKS